MLNDFLASENTKYNHFFMLYIVRIIYFGVHNMVYIMFIQIHFHFKIIFLSLCLSYVTSISGSHFCSSSYYVPFFPSISLLSSSFSLLSLLHLETICGWALHILVSLSKTWFSLCLHMLLCFSKSNFLLCLIGPLLSSEEHNYSF